MDDGQRWSRRAPTPLRMNGTRQPDGLWAARLQSEAVIACYGKTVFVDGRQINFGFFSAIELAWN
jgi:hypothetical protein